jgi:hypothetical protein
MSTQVAGGLHGGGRKIAAKALTRRADRKEGSMATDLRQQRRGTRDRNGTRPVRGGSRWLYVVAVIALIVVAAAAVLVLWQEPPPPAVRIGSYPELARTEAREGGPYVQAADLCYAFERFPGRGGPRVRVPCEPSNGPTETPAERNSVEAREGRP